MKTYIGYGMEPNKGGPCEVLIEDGDTWRALPHQERHSPTGFSWGYGGSGPSDLARSLLWDVLGHEPPTWLYQEFKWSHVAKWPMHPGVCWRISEKELREWLVAADYVGGPRLAPPWTATDG